MREPRRDVAWADQATRLWVLGQLAAAQRDHQAAAERLARVIRRGVRHAMATGDGREAIAKAMGVTVSRVSQLNRE